MKRANARAMYEVHENCINGFLKKKKKEKKKEKENEVIESFWTRRRHVLEIWIDYNSLKIIDYFS